MCILSEEYRTRKKSTRVSSYIQLAYSIANALLQSCPGRKEDGRRSFINMEIVVAVYKRKLASIDVIGMEQYPFEAVLGKEIGAGLMKVSIVLLSCDPVTGVC